MAGFIHTLIPLLNDKSIITPAPTGLSVWRRLVWHRWLRMSWLVCPCSCCQCRCSGFRSPSSMASSSTSLSPPLTATRCATGSPCCSKNKWVPKDKWDKSTLLNFTHTKTFSELNEFKSFQSESVTEFWIWMFYFRAPVYKLCRTPWSNLEFNLRFIKGNLQHILDKQ